MFESQVAYYLNKYLGTYLEGIDSASLRISVFRGDVELTNLQLKPDALDDLDLPVVVKGGLLGSLTLKVPWSGLGRVPVEVKMDRLYVLAGPRPDTQRGKGVVSPAEVEAAFQQAKKQRVEKQEAKWVEELEHLQQQRDRQKEGADGNGAKESGGGGPGMLKAVIDTVIGNLQLSITNVHVRYEDDISNPGQPFACGVTLERLGAYTVDEMGKEAFVTNNPLDILRKAAQLRRLSIYFDTSTQFWDPGQAWRALAPQQWDTWFLPGVAAAGQRQQQQQQLEGTAKGREFVLQPVDGRALYTRRGSAAQRGNGEPVLEMSFELDVVALRLSQPQYQSYQLLLSEVSSFTSRLPYNAFRPRMRPAAGESCRSWWRYAFLAVRAQLLSRKLTWGQAVEFARARKAYVPLYAQLLRAQLNAAFSRHDLANRVAAMDKGLPENTILMFRRLAHAEVQREKRREARAAAKAGTAAKKQDAGKGTWFGWLTGAGGGEQAGGAAAGTAASAAEGGVLRGDLAPEEYARLLELVSEQEEGLKLGTETPYTLLTRVSAKVGSASAILVAADCTRILRGGLEGVSSTFSKYPQTTQVDLAVTAMGVESPEGVFIRTGAELHRAASAADLSEEMYGAGQEGSGDRALQVTYTQSPQDGSADAVVDVVLTPSYVHYSAATPERVVNFFKAPQALDFSAIGAAASSKLDKARRLAADYAAAALRSRPKLRMSLCLDAPKVAVPVGEGKGQVTLVLDLGRFVIRSDPVTAGRLPGEEAALYECIRLDGKDVSAYVVDGPFDWHAREQGDREIPLLERCGLDIALQAARFQDPRFPMIRLQPSVPVLHFYLSPGRLGRLMRVLRAALPEGESQPGGATGAVPNPEEEPWREHAEQEGALRVLTWTGIGKSTLVWCPRFGVVYQGRLYIYDSESSSKPVATHSFWSDQRVAKVPADAIGGVDHVLALLPPSADISHAAEEKGAVLLRLDSEEEADSWYRRLLAAQQSMRDLSGEIGPALPDWDEGSSTISASDTDEISNPALLAPPQQAQLAQQQGPLTLLQVDAQLGELAVFVSGREPQVWWPPMEPVPSEIVKAAECCTEPVVRAEDIVNVDGEGALICLRAAGGACRFTYGDLGMVVCTALGSLEVEDLLVGPRCPQARFLARSNLPADGVVQTEGDLFFDPDEALLSADARSRSGSLQASPVSSPVEASHQPPEDSAAQQAQRELAEFDFRIVRPTSPDYKGVDTSLDVSLRTLYFYCNRPTVAALMSLGTDISDAIAAAQQDGGAGGGSEEGSGGKGSDDEGGSGDEGDACKAEGMAAIPGAQSGDGAGNAAKVLGGGDDRVVFQLAVSLSRLQVVLNYEGAKAQSLSQASMDEFDFKLETFPERMAIAASLGNIQGVDCTLPANHPYHQALGLRSGSDTSLVSLNFGSHPATEANPRVPEGQPYYTLGAKLSRMQVVFLYRFLQENLSYITTMLAMRLPPVHPQAAGQLEQLQEQQQHAEEQQESQEGQGQEQQQQQPFLLLLDVEMDAPVISLPRNTHSKDLVESDLGVLKLTNRIVEQGQTSRGKPLLLDASELSFSGLDVVVVKGAKRGHNIIQNSEQGWQLSWRRPVVQGFEGLVPMFDMMLNIPFLKALLTDEEYQLMTSIAGDNFSEQPGLPQGAQWLTDHYQAQQDQQDGQQQQEGQQEQGPTAELVLSPPPGAQQPAAGLLVPTAKDDSPTKVRVVVSVGHVELELHRHVEGMQGTSPLARFTLGDLWVAFRNSQAGSMWVALCLPRVEAQDLRPDVPLEQSYAISSAHKASFLMMDWSASPGLVNQALAITLQKPLLVAELSFLLALTKWVVPGFSFGNNSPIAFGTHDILLSGSPHKASGDLWLSPTVRLLADAPGVTSFEYDGQGHSLTLPGKDHLDEQLPLILIGPGRTLRLRNVRLVNAATLPLCLQLAPGAQLLAEAQDSVSRIDGEADLAAGVGSPLSPRSLFARGLSAYATTSATSELSPQPSQAHSPSASAPQGPPGGSAGAAPQRSMQISVCAVGMALQFMQLQPQQGLQREGSMGAVGAGAERPGSAASGDERSRHSRAGSVESLASLRRASSAELAQQGALQRTKQAQPSSPVQILSAAMDVAATYKAQGTLQSGQVGIQGLRVETRFLADAAAKAQGRGEQQDFTQKKKLKGQMESTVLEPCSVALDFTLQPPGDGGAAGGRTDLNLDTSDLRLNLSPDVLELATSLAGSVAQPLMQPGPDQALIACTSFERIWTYDPSKDMPDQRQLAASLSVAGAEGGVTVWRPQCPPGYTVVGDVLTSGNSQPTFEVLAVAVNSGLVAYPQEYSLIWSGAGGSIWRPVPPEGYVALGDLVTCQGEPEPQLTAMACVHGSVVVEAPLGECLRLPPVLPTAPAAAAQAEAELTPVDLWCVDSSLATFLATTANSTEPGRGYDVRNPLGVTPAALAALPLPGSPDPRALFQHFCSSRKEQRTDEIHRVTTPTVVDFHRIWTDGGAITNGEGISIWRPAVAPGYASLGDCIMRGLDPPPSALVVRDGGGAEGEGLGQPGGMPLVAHPQGFQRVWMDLAQREEARLCLWLPVPKPGYVAMGCLATRGTASPPRGAAKCLRADAATQALASRSPLWVVRQEDRVMTPLSAWVADERLHTFVVAASDRASQPRECWRLRTSASEQAEASTHNATLQQQVGGVSVVARTGRASLVLRDSFRVPIVEVDLGALSAGVSGPSQQVVQAHLKLRLSVWSYNGAVRGWDPVVEPWDVLANMDTNLKGKVACGIEPGVHLSLKTSNEMIHTTLTFAALHSLLSAYADWQALRTHDPYRQLLSAVDKSSIKVEVENRLGVDATLELDWGDELRTVELPTSQPVPVIKPLPRFPTRQPEGLAGVTAATRAREAKPHDLLLVDVRELVAGGTGSGTVADKAQLYCSARLEGAAEQPAAGAVPGAPFRTRAVPWDAGKSSVAWKERLVLPIPIKPGTVLALVFEVWDVAAEGGSGALLGFGKVMLPAVSKLKEREKQEADVELDQGGFTLQAAYMLQHQWHEDGGAARPAGTSTVWAESTVGQRALCLATNPGVWAVVPTSGQQKGSGGGAVASLTPIKVGSEGVVLEATVDQGQRRETLRAPCQVFNNTQFPLEVSLVTVDDGDWQLVASRAGSVSGALSKDLVEEEVFENERWVSLKGWSSNNLRPEDPGKFRYQRRQYDDLPQVSLPPGWEWDGGWTLDRGGSVDKEGWAYAPDFSQLKFPPPPGAQKPSLADTVRSRRWLRYRRPAAGTSASRGPSLATASAQRSAAAPAAQQQGLAVRDRSWLGRVEPGGAQPLPLDWQRAGRRLQFRPVADPDLTTPVHDWSAGASEGPHTVKLECLDESLTRLAYCAPNLPAGAVVPGSEGASTLWFSITVDSDILAGGKQAEPLTDWRILVGPPLVLVNQLPISTSLLIWEKPQGSDKVVDRQTVQLASGGQVAVYGADMRAQVSFTLYTDAYEWVEAGPLVISQGQQGRPGRQSHLPDRFRLRRTGGSIPVEVFVQRHVDFGTWLLDAREELDPGAVAAKGVPLSVTLLSPLWVVNATSLAIDAAIVQVPPPPPAPKQDVSAIAAQQATGPSLGSKEHLRTLVTGDTQASARDDSFALRGRPIAPRSMEMLSYPLPSHLVAQQAQQGGSTGAGEPPSRRQYYGVRLRVAGSGWTPPLALDIVEVGGGGAQGAQTAETNLQNAQPLLIQARVPEFGAVYEVLARLEISQFKNSQVLRLEPHMVVSNRTSVPLQLLQCRPVLAAEGMATAAPGGGRPGAQRVGTLVPEGGASFSQATRGLNNMPLASGESTPLVRPSPSYIDRKWLGQPSPSFVGLSGDSTVGWERIPSVLPTGPTPLVRVAPPSQRALHDASALIDLPAGATAIPLHLSAGVPTHTLCFRSAPAAAATITAIGGAPLWSRPITLRYPQEQTLHLLVPISLEEAASAGAGGATSGSSPTGRADTPQEGGLQGGAEGRPSAYLSPAVFDATAGGSDGGSGAASEDAGRRGGGHVKRDSAHLTVLAAEPGAAPGRGGAPGGAVAVLRVRVSLRGFGGLHVVLETLQSDPPYLLENRTPLPLNYRQAHIKAAPFHTLPPWSAVGWVWEYTLHGAPNELEVQEALAQNPQLYALDPPESSASGKEQPASAAGKVRPLPVTGDIGQCTVKLGYWEQVVMTPVGLGTIGGESSAGGLGRGGIDRVMQLAPGAERLLLAGKSGGQGGPLELDMAFELPGVEVSIVDHTPQELLLLTLTGLKVSATRGPTPSGAQNSLRFQLAQFQIDDQLFGARFPVVLATAPSALAARQQLQRGASPADLPLLSLTLSKQAGGARGRTFYPYAGLRAPLALQLAVSETLVWRVAEFLQRVQARQQQHTSGTAAGADGPQHEPTALHDTAAADMPLHIGLLHVDDLRAELSFQGDPLSRPRYISGGMVATLLDLANFTAASITLRGLDEPDISMLRSAFVQRIAQKVQGQVFGIAFSLVRNFGIVGGASKLLGALSAGVAKLAAAEVTPEASAAKQAQRRTITDVGDGVVEGMGALGQSFMRGLQGLVKKPVQGMQQKGVGGAIVGVGQGLVGALANPVSGMLDALSATAEGFNASFGRKRDDALVWQRRRLPRAVGGEGRLQPIIGSDGTDRQARIDALGQALLKNTLLNAPDATLKRRHEPTEAYEQHFVLVEDRVVILTSRGIMLVVAPNFAVLDGAAEIGEELRVVDVPPGTREWCVPWGDLLTLELRWTSDDPNADRLIVHRKGKPGVQETESLAHQLKCFPKTGQAAQIKLVTQKVLGKYCLDPQRRDRAWTRRHQSHQELPQGAGPAQLPLTMPCLDFEPAWRTTAHRISSAVSFWTPVAPPGYRPAGDVVTLGTDPPGNPVPCLRDFTLCGGAGAPPVAAAGLTSPAESQQQHKPATCHPREYSLVWRQNSATPVTVWMPVPPLGYVALGAVVVGRAEVPGTDDYVCIREDLTSASQVFNSPLWSLDPLSLLGGGGGAAASTAAAMALQRKKPHHPETWKISVWQVDNRLGTFLAVRAFNKPPQNMIRTVDAVEEKEKAKLSAGGGV